MVVTPRTASGDHEGLARRCLLFGWVREGYGGADAVAFSGFGDGCRGNTSTGTRKSRLRAACYAPTMAVM